MRANLGPSTGARPVVLLSRVYSSAPGHICPVPGKSFPSPTKVRSCRRESFRCQGGSKATRIRQHAVVDETCGRKSGVVEKPRHNKGGLPPFSANIPTLRPEPIPEMVAVPVPARGEDSSSRLSRKGGNPGLARAWARAKAWTPCTTRKRAVFGPPWRGAVPPQAGRGVYAPTQSQPSRQGRSKSMRGHTPPGPSGHPPPGGTKNVRVPKDFSEQGKSLE